MALDKQKILSELGSVMNQLQSADCGCMGKLFSNQSGGQEGTTMANCPVSESFGGYGGCRHQCCHGHGGFNICDNAGFSASGAGEPHRFNGTCMGKCNPRKMYTDTYNYLNPNLMQPVVKEVYDDLKSITPENTVMNNAMAAKMGMGQAGNLMQGVNSSQGKSFQDGISAHGKTDGQMGMQQNVMMTNNMGNHMQRAMQNGTNMLQTTEQAGDFGMHKMQGNLDYQNVQNGYQMGSGLPLNQMYGGNMGDHTNMSMNNTQEQQMTNPKMTHMMGGMGPQIVNMMQSGAEGKAMSSPQGGEMPGNMPVNASNPHYGSEGFTPLSANAEMSQVQYNYNPEMSRNFNQQMHVPATQYVTNANMIGEFNPNAQTNMTNAPNNNNTVSGNLQQNPLNPSTIQNSFSPNTQKFAMPNGNYGQHTQGIKKFNEMFPGVMGGDLGFDPMEIAIQMNPANSRSAAMNVMQKMMSGNQGNMNAIAGANASENMIQGNNAQAKQPIIPQSSQQVVSPVTPIAQNNQYQGISNINTAITPSYSNQIPQQQVHNVYNTNNLPQQELFDGNQLSAQNIHTGDATMGQGKPHQQIPVQQQLQYQQQFVDPNTGAIIPQAMLNQEATGHVSDPEQQQPAPDPHQIMIKDPIFPSNNSGFQPPSYMQRPRNHEFNTLGQRVEMLPARLYHSNPETNLPQTLSPQPVTGKLRKDIDRFHVKSTVSKTSLMGTKPVGRTPSRNQLQHIYNQYKGSQSSTQQRVRAQEQGGSYSEGKIVEQDNLKRTLPAVVERVGGDTVTNNQTTHQQVPIKGETNQNIYDDINKPHGDIMPTKDAPIKSGNCRNGLQDMTYSTYPTSAASWSFHGNPSQRAPYSSSHRYRFRV